MYKFSLFELLGKSYWFIEAEADHQYQFTLKQNARTWVNITLMITGLFHVKKRHKGLCFSCRFWTVRRPMDRYCLLSNMIFLGNFFNHFGFRCVFASSFFLFNKCVTKARLALSRIQSNPAFRTPALPVPGVRIEECGAKEESDKKIRRKRGRGREEGTPVRFVFRRSFRPLCRSNLNLVFGVKSCQSSNGWQTALFTEFWKNMPVFTFYICFLQANISLTSKNERTGKHLKLVPLPLPLIFTQLRSCCRVLLSLLKCCLNLFVSEKLQRDVLSQ